MPWKDGLNTRNLLKCGIAAPIIFIFAVVLGGAIRPGYSHLSETISELFSPGSPNKLLLDSLHTTYAVLLILFGFGILLFVRDREGPSKLGGVGASLFILMGLISATTATIFPQDPWGSPPTLPGRMHIILHGIIGLISIAYMILLGKWLKKTRLLPWFKPYSFVTVVFAAVFTGIFFLSTGGPYMGLAERMAGLVGFQWIILLAVNLLREERKIERPEP